MNSGKHLGAVRSWIKWNVSNGEQVTWGSNDELQHKFTVRDLEEISQRVADATTAELKAQLEHAHAENARLLAANLKLEVGSILHFTIVRHVPQRIVLNASIHTKTGKIEVYTIDIEES